jgi:surface protein
MKCHDHLIDKTFMTMFSIPPSPGGPSSVMNQISVVRASHVPDVPAFRFEVRTTGADTFQLPLLSAGSYNFDIDWGDSNSDTITVWNQAETNHSYAGAGTYYCVITGTTCRGWSFNNGGDKDLIYDISEWGDIFEFDDITTGQFRGCSNLQVSATDAPILSNTTNIGELFRDCDAIVSMDLSAWDVSGCTRVAFAFYSNPSLVSAGIGNWDVSSVTRMESAFEGGLSFSEDLSNWDVSSVTHMQSIFRSGVPVPVGSIDGWNVGSVIDISGMFRQNRVATLNLSAWNVENVTSFAFMFASSLDIDWSNNDISGWNVAKGANFWAFASGSWGFNVNLNSWNMGAATYLREFFSGSSSYNQPLSNWNTINVWNMDSMFKNATVFDQDISAWNVTSVTDMTNMLSGSAFSQTNYDLLLVAWEAQAVQNNVSFHAGSAKFGAGAPATAKLALEADHNWTITDGGAA